MLQCSYERPLNPRITSPLSFLRLTKCKRTQKLKTWIQIVFFSFKRVSTMCKMWWLLVKYQWRHLCVHCEKRRHLLTLECIQSPEYLYFTHNLALVEIWFNRSMYSSTILKLTWGCLLLGFCHYLSYEHQVNSTIYINSN